MEGIADKKTTEEKLFAWARLVSATVVFILGSVVINRLIEAMVVKGGGLIRPLLAAALIFVLIYLVINILSMR